MIALLSSCARPTFQSFYKTEKDNARLALAFPKYFAMIAMPDDVKEDVKYFTNGMKKVRLLYFEDDFRTKPDFTKYANQNQYAPYLVVKEDGSKINIFADHDGDVIREIVLDVQSQDEGFIMALIGKMEIERFQEALEEAREN